MVYVKVFEMRLNKRSKNTPYEISHKKVSNLSYLKIWDCRAVVRLTEPKRKIWDREWCDICRVCENLVEFSQSSNQRVSKRSCAQGDCVDGLGAKPLNDGDLGVKSDFISTPVLQRLQALTIYSSSIPYDSDLLRQDLAAADVRQRISIIHREHIFPDLTKLQDHLIVVRWRRLWRLGRSGHRWGGNQLEVLDGGDRHPPPEIQTPALQLFVPPGRLVFKDQGQFGLFAVGRICGRRRGSHDLGKPRAAEFRGVVEGLGEGHAPERVFEGAWREKKLGLTWHGPAWLEGGGGDRVHDAVHPAGPTCAKHVKLVGDVGNVVAAARHFR
ncbi:hypothetical protein OSB04_006538 [Centaurea solstitialis]|uniref:Uncharacterized protein n=1 Tax=Centaurea solstitialis TaxID=347529 RepID=A0AA38TQQ5_9ASTR|nr:hypothetical protein OSB04_006538 [Centaurea solstitialis]